jgi:truncated hemoglobin YjbI
VQYKGKAPATAHAGMKITDAEMAIFLDLLGKAMDDYTVNPQAKGELLALLAKQGQALVGL